MIDQLVRAKLQAFELVHVRMAFSSTEEDVGSVRIGKLAHLASVIARTLEARTRHHATILYYPPAGGSRVPVLRDLVLLSCLRGFFKHVVFHFHAAGVADVEQELPAWARPVFRRAYHGADLAIVASTHVREDAERLHAKAIAVIPPGLHDEYAPYAEHAALARATTRDTQLLYVGLLCESKGVLLLLDAVAALRARGFQVDLKLVGAFASEAFRIQLTQRIAQLAIADRVELCGVLTGHDKWHMYASADVMCFPTYYSAETFGLVAIEAMQFELPVIASRFRSLPSIIDHGVTGLLVAPNDSDALTEAIADLCRDPARRRAMGSAGRRRFLDCFTHEQHVRAIEDALSSM